MSEVLFAAEIAFRRLYRCMPQQELNLLQLATVRVQLGTRPPQVMWGMRPSMARLTLARKIASITLTMWKKGVSFDPKQLQRQAA